MSWEEKPTPPRSPTTPACPGKEGGGQAQGCGEGVAQGVGQEGSEAELERKEGVGSTAEERRFSAA